MTMGGGARAPVRFGRTVLQVSTHSELAFMAASIAYYAFVSLLPLLLLLLVVFSTIGGEALAENAADIAEAYLTPQGQELIAGALSGGAGEVGASVVGLAILLWSALRGSRAMNIAFARIYGTSAERSLLDDLQKGTLVLVAIGLALAVVTATGVLFALLDGVPYIGLLSPLALLAGLTAIFFPMYYLFPNVDVTVREVLPGAVVAAIGWASLEALFGLYVATASQYQAYGVIGGVILLVTWLYFGGIVLLFGVVVNVVAAGRVELDEPDSEEADSRLQEALAHSRRLWRESR
ncbi:YihY/virulence factor BrkB family protein [Halobacteriales archaeon QS_3_64_16]|nr:MAG: YihY/virulence factor BrkB family protein [Halobacteriales archaeon QS_3_64_16]